MSEVRRPHRGRSAPVRSLLAALVVAFAATALPLVGARPAVAEPAPTYRPPVDAAVSDPFRPPSTPYGPGNRGLEYDPPAGAPVRAAADGVVTFAGLVAGTRHVTVRHADGLRTTVSYLASVAVVVGQHVGQGDLLGTASGRLLFSARSGDAYLDPASLFDPAPVRVRLVPFEEPPGDGPDSDASAIGQLIGFGRGAVHGVGSVAGSVAGSVVALPGAATDWFVDHGGDVLRVAGVELGLAAAVAVDPVRRGSRRPGRGAGAAGGLGGVATSLFR